MNEEILDDKEVIAPIEEVVEKPETLRETIEKARDLANSEEAPEKVIKEPKVRSTKAKERDDTGKFVAKETEEKPLESPKEEVIQAPTGYSAAVKAKFHELPREIQQELSKREQDVHRELTKHDEERNFGRQMKDVVTPYIAQIRAEGAEPAQAVASLLNMAHVLRVGSLQQKSELLLRTAQTFGVDLRQALQGQQAQPQLPPQFQNVVQELHGLKQRYEQDAMLKKQQEDAEIQTQIGSFSADPKHVHFETVKAHMAALLTGGLAKDLQDAYDQAVYANPHTRSTLLSAQSVESDQKRVAEQKAKAEAAKKAGSSIKGSPGIAASKNAKINGLDLRSTIRSAMAEHLDS